MITFADACAVVASAGDVVADDYGDNYRVADYGWQNSDVYLVVAEPADGVLRMDTPALLVNKDTGKLTPVYGLLGHDPAPDLTPIGTPPGE